MNCLPMPRQRMVIIQKFSLDLRYAVHILYRNTFTDIGDQNYKAGRGENVRKQISNVNICGDLVIPSSKLLALQIRKCILKAV